MGGIILIKNKRKTTQKIVIASVLIVAATLLFINYSKYIFKAEDINNGESEVLNLTNNGDQYPDSTKESPKIPKFEKFELTFDLEWHHNRDFQNPAAKYDPIADSTINPYWPYEETPVSPGVAAGVGVSVDGLFSQDNWQTTVTQPGFYYQDYEAKTYNNTYPGENWFYPNGNPQWKIRFTPSKTGNWQYKIRVSDATGTINTQPLLLESIASNNRGFVKVGDTDKRYFETTGDNKFLNLVGIEGVQLWDGQKYWDNQTIDNIKLKDDPGSDINNPYKILSDNGINLVRQWNPTEITGAGQNGLYWWSAGAGTTLNITGDPIVLTGSPNNRKLSGSFTASGDKIINYKSVYVNKNGTKKYQFSVWVKTVGIGGGNVYLVAQGGSGGGGINDIVLSEPTSKITGDHDWTKISGTFTTTNSQERSELRIKTTGTTGGAVYFTDASAKEDLTPSDPNDSQFGSELIWTPNFDTYAYKVQATSWYYDKIVETAHYYGVYLKPILMLRQNAVLNRIQPDGQIGNSNDTNFYSINPTDAGRVYHNYYFRYLIARYGYSSNIHSFDLENEASPGNSNAWQAANLSSQYFIANDPNKHLFTTTLQSGFSSSNWVDNPDLSYADWHNYIGERDVPTSNRVTESNYGWDFALHVGNVYNWADLIKRNGFLDNSTYVSAPASLILTNTAKNQAKSLWLWSRNIPINPTHQYKFSWKIKGENITPEPATSNRYPTVQILWKTNYSSKGAPHLREDYTPRPWNASQVPAFFDWQSVETDLIVPPSNAQYVMLSPANVANAQVGGGLTGDFWYDDIKIFDVTDNKYLEFAEGDFNSNRIDEDTALMSYYKGLGVGYDNNRHVQKPVIDGNAGIMADKKFGDTYKGHVYGTDEYFGTNQSLYDDTDGVWYRKYLWGSLNKYAIYTLFYHGEEVLYKDPDPATGTRKVVRSAKAFQNFVSDLDLSNGQYKDAEATTSDNNLRAWGQKQIDPQTQKADKAHLWIDNKPYTWKNVVDGNIPTPISGTVTISDMKDGTYKVEWWDTTNGTIIKTEEKVAQSPLVLEIIDLVSDVAVKIYPAQAAPPSPPTPTLTPTSTPTTQPTIEPTPTPTPSDEIVTIITPPPTETYPTDDSSTPRSSSPPQSQVTSTPISPVTSNPDSSISQNSPNINQSTVPMTVSGKPGLNWWKIIALIVILLLIIVFVVFSVIKRKQV